MSWKNRETGHVVLEQADFSHLADLRKSVGVRVYSRAFKKRTVWLIGTGTSTKGKWNPGDHPFAEESPAGSKAFGDQVQELAAPFCAAIDALVEHNRAIPRDRWPKNPLTGKPYQPSGGRKSRGIGELSLGLQMATLLGVPVFSFISDPDADDELACVTAPGEVRRVLCQRDRMVFEFAAGVLSVSPERPKFLAKIRGVRTAAPVREYDDDMHGLVTAELDAFAGKGFADPDQVLPGVDELVFVGERTATGKYQAQE